MSRKPAIAVIGDGPRAVRWARLFGRSGGAAGEDASVLVLAAPAFDVPRLLKKLAPRLRPDQIVVHTALGFVLDEDHLRTHAEIIRRQTCVKKTGFLAGPMTAAEADAGERATCVVASPFPEVASAVRDGLADSSLHVFRSGDLVGHEIAAALAAAYAIAMGITAGLDFGPGYRGLTLTRAVAEMTRFGTARGARASSFIGVAGLGALYAAMADETHACVRLGIELAASTRKKKVTPGDDLTREAVEIVRAAASHAKQNALSVPVLEALDRICSGRSAVKTEIERLNVQAVHAEDRVTDDLDRLHLSRLPLAPRGGPGKD